MGRAAPGIILVLLLSAVLPVALAAGPAPAPAPERRLVSLDVDPPGPGSPLGGTLVVEAFPFARVALVQGTPAQLARLALVPGVAGVYEEEPLALHLDRARAVVRADPPARDADWPTGEGVTVALVDSGLDARHPAFEGRVAASVRIARSGGVSPSGVDDEGHGTHVAGILGGDGAASRGGRLHGLAPGARLVGVDISDAFTTTSAVRAFAWIHEHRHEHAIQVVSNSWGREKEGARYDPDDPVIRASDALVADGMVVVFSAGNRGRDGASSLTPEAMNPNVLTVGSASPHGQRESYSSQGPALDASGARLAWTKPDLMAPGSAILSTRSGALAPPDGADEEARHYVVMNGTSMAAPQAAAAAALLRARHPDLSPAMVVAILQGTARDLGAKGADDATGFGMLDVAGALAAADLVAEGDQRVVVERHVPVRLAGRVVAAATAVVLAGDEPLLPPDEDVVLPLALPSGAARAELLFNWSGPGEFEVVLEGDAGAWRFDRVRAGRLALAADAPPGAYRIVVRPTGVAAHTTYTVEGHLVVREERLVEVPHQFEARPFSAQGGFFLPETPAGRVLAVVGQAPFLALALMSGLACVVGLRLRRR